MSGARTLLLTGFLIGCLGLLSSVHAATLANLWVNAGGGTCARSPIPTTYIASSACGSLNAAYQAASAGDFILIKGGNYGSQNIANRAALGSAQVIFQIAEGETMRIVAGSLSVDSHHVTIHGGDSLGVDETNRIVITQDGSGGANGECSIGMVDGAGNRNVIFEDITCGSFFLEGWGSTVRYSRIGPHQPCSDGSTEDLFMVWPTGSLTPPQNVTVEHNEIAGMSDSSCPGRIVSRHSDALFVTGSNHTIRGNRIYWCGTQCFAISNFPTMPNNILVENNMIEATDPSLCPDCQNSNTIGMAGTNIVFRYNSLDIGSISTGVSGTTIAWKGNIFLTSVGVCPQGTFTYNVFPSSGGTTCGTNTKRGTPKLANGSLFTSTGLRSADFHLHPTDTVAAGAGDPTSFPAIDFDGLARVPPPSAGASQVAAGGSQSPPTAPTGLGISRATEETPLTAHGRSSVPILWARSLPENPAKSDSRSRRN